MTSVNETTGILTPQAYSDRHKKAFRVAFDFLNRHFPPSPEPDWWDNTVTDAVKAVNDDTSNLTRDLVLAVFDYIDRECKMRMDLHG